MEMLLPTFDLLGEATAMLETPLRQHYRGAREVQGRLVMKKIKKCSRRNNSKQPDKQQIRTEGFF